LLVQMSVSICWQVLARVSTLSHPQRIGSSSHNKYNRIAYPLNHVDDMPVLPTAD